MINLPSVRHLRHLTALHDYGHFGRAADACHVTQSTLSASIKELEGVLQVTLVDRSKRRVVLTPVGVETVERARKIVREVENLVSFATASRDPLCGILRLGAIPTIGPFLQSSLDMCVCRMKTREVASEHFRYNSAATVILDPNDITPCHAQLTGWVCEAHADRPWNDHPNACRCGEPPCPMCNEPADGERPRMPRGFRPTINRDKGPLN